MKLNYKCEFGAFAPIRAYRDDAGWDLRTPKRFGLFGHESEVIDTKLKVEIPRGYYGKIESKSGLMVNDDIIATGGVIDCGFNGTIRVKLHNLGNRMKVFDAGDKIAQLIIIPIADIDEAVEIEEMEETERGENGFGSTGK